MLRQLSAKWLRRVLNLWPPYFGARIKVIDISEDWRYAKVLLKKSFLNTNYFGTAFGGSLFSMTDPFMTLLLTNRLGRDFIVWDKSAAIKYIKPGTTHVFAEFHLSDEQVHNIRQAALANEKYEPEFVVNVIDANNELIARVEKKLYVKKKNRPVIRHEE